MNERLQILYMQTRLVRLASTEWNMTMEDVNRLFAENGVYSFISEFWDLFHMEGDLAVLDDIEVFLQNRRQVS